MSGNRKSRPYDSKYGRSSRNFRFSRGDILSQRSYDSRINRRNEERVANSYKDADFIAYETAVSSSYGQTIKYRKVKEINGDLFQAPEEYSLVHCVAEDMNMGSGIAVEFRYKFKQIGYLLNQHQRTGGMAVLTDDRRYVYYLVTKRFSSGKPTLETLFSSLKHLRNHVIKHKVRKLAMPRIACGLDRLEWPSVKFMLEFIFKEVDADITVCNLDHVKGSTAQRHRNCKVIHEKRPIQFIDSETVVIYFCSEDEYVSDDMTRLDEKFHFLSEFKRARKSKGDVIFHSKNPGYLLCGCIVRKNRNDLFDFMALEKCLSKIQMEKRSTRFYYFAFEAFRDETDQAINYKVINILRNDLKDVDLHVCWPCDLVDAMEPKGRQFL